MKKQINKKKIKTIQITIKRIKIPRIFFDKKKRKKKRV
jgi:hypothetical protein